MDHNTSHDLGFKSHFDISYCNKDFLFHLHKVAGFFQALLVFPPSHIRLIWVVNKSGQSDFSTISEPHDHVTILLQVKGSLLIHILNVQSLNTVKGFPVFSFFFKSIERLLGTSKHWRCFLSTAYFKLSMVVIIL